MSLPRVLCLGEILFDCLADQIGKPYEAVESWTPYPGGAPANVACALVKLGTSAGFVGCIGEDEPGDRLVTLLEEVGVERTGIQRHPTAPTRQVYVVRTTDGDREFAGFGEFDTREFADTHLQAEALPESLFESADFLVMGTLEMAYPDSEVAIARARELAQQYGIRVLIDVNWRPVFWQDAAAAKAKIRAIVETVDFLKLSDDEAQWLFETPDAAAVAQHLPQVSGVLVTRGSRGCSYCFGEVSGDIPAFSVQAQDTTGAGDGFAAGFVHQLCLRGVETLQDAETVREMVEYASAVGGLTATKPGAIAAQPTAEEVRQFLDRQ
ncbi:carbohydrate kinase family protein [Baaleninema simplex]|uniref:carbohydrate kinase family protein n=1 Tax=Baaleninema simplex TaxID=2862350 RepID=UPI0004774DF8|nr:carbohydrate kinase [Baaleninema simplex]